MTCAFLAFCTSVLTNGLANSSNVSVVHAKC